MSEYQVLARKYRPQTFKDVLGQEAVVTTLKNAIKQMRLAHAYLFCGSRGTGKTTLARIFAKALNCLNPTADGEPCNGCASCKEITGGHSLDVLEIDGASNRGIEDIRQINETVGYTTASGKYKIYIIDEVHMLTKEAFNALLKTLEEPPPKVKFFFATTEPHKVLPTILSRCQRFNLNRIPLETIISKLQKISDDQKLNVAQEALKMVASRAEGGLRDAESLFDQVISFHEGQITVEAVANVLGVLPSEIYFTLDKAGKEGDFAVAFDVVHQIFSEGKDFIHFIDGLIEHYRTLLLVKVGCKLGSDKDLQSYQEAAQFYSREQCLNIMEVLVDAQSKIRFMPSPRIGLEALLLKILRTHRQIPVELLVQRLSELEGAVKAGGAAGGQSQAQVQAAPAVQQQSVVRAAQIQMAPTPQPAQPKSAPAAVPAAPKAEKIEKAEKVERVEIDKKTQGKHDTLFQFAAVELEGTLKKKV